VLSKLFPNNVHSVDRALRTVIGLGLLSLVFIGPHSYWGLVGILPLMTGLIGTCPAYTLFGFSTCKPCGGGASRSTAKD
jgi:hypothetical protein